MSIVTVGIDLAKNIFAVHGVDETGKAALVKPKVVREQLSALMVQLPPCVIGMEAFSGAHHWARLFRQYGHTVKLMAPKFVTPYRMSGKRCKNDAADAAPTGAPKNWPLHPGCGFIAARSLLGKEHDQRRLWTALMIRTQEKERPQAPLPSSSKIFPSGVGLQLFQDRRIFEC